MPTARWDNPQELFGYLEEEEAQALVPLLGGALYRHLLEEYDRLMQAYKDITATTVRPTGVAKKDAELAHADVTERLELITQGRYRETFTTPEDGVKEVTEADMATIRLIRICQRIEWYRMLSHKAWLLSVSLNGGGGMNMVGADGYEPAGNERIERMSKDAFMSAGRAVDDLLLFLEADAKDGRRFTEKWQEADAFYLHRDLLFQTARVLDEYLDIRGDRMAYVALVRDIRFCQNTYLRPRVGAGLLRAVVEYANDGRLPGGEGQDGQEGGGRRSEVFGEMTDMLRTALAFYVEARRVSLEPAREKVARRDSVTDAQQAMAAACEYIGQHLEEIGVAAEGSPIYDSVRAREELERQDRDCACGAAARRRAAACGQSERKLFTGFPATHRSPEHK